MWRYLNRGVSDVNQDQSKVDDKGTGECKYNYLKKCDIHILMYCVIQRKGWHKNFISGKMHFASNMNNFCKTHDEN